MKRATRKSRTAELLAEARRGARSTKPVSDATMRLATRQIERAARELRDRCDITNIVRAARTLARAEQQGAALGTVSDAQRNLDQVTAAFQEICVKPRTRVRTP